MSCSVVKPNNLISLLLSPYEPGEAMTCEPSVSYGLGVTLWSVLGSHIADFPLFSPRIVKLAAHA